MKETTDQWYEDVMRRYKDGERVLMDAKHRAEEYWRDADLLRAVFDDRPLNPGAIGYLITIRQLLAMDREYSPALLQGACMMLLDCFNRDVVDHIVDTGDYYDAE